MKKIILVTVLAAGLGACNQNTQGQNAALGGAGGALVGAGIAAAAGANTTETLLAAGAGAAAGAILGAATTRADNGRCVDEFGNILPPGRYRLPDGRVVNCA